MSAPITEAMRPRPVKPMRTLDASVQQTSRDYANHLNMMLDYYIDLSKWLEESLTASEKHARDLELLLQREPAQGHTKMWQDQRRAILEQK